MAQASCRCSVSSPPAFPGCVQGCLARSTAPAAPLPQAPLPPPGLPQVPGEACPSSEKRPLWHWAPWESSPRFLSQSASVPRFSSHLAGVPSHSPVFCLPLTRGSSSGPHPSLFSLISTCSWDLLIPSQDGLPARQLWGLQLTPAAWPCRCIRSQTELTPSP